MDKDDKINFPTEQEYVIGNHRYIVKRHFKEDAKDDLCTILLRLMLRDVEDEIRGRYTGK